MHTSIPPIRGWRCTPLVVLLLLVLSCGEGEPLLKLHSCDTEAAHPADPDKWDAGLGDAYIVPGRAVAACREAVEQHPATARFHFQLGRALWASGLIEDGLEAFLDASDRGYAPAYHYLAHAYRVGLVPDESADPDFAEELSARAVAGGFRVEAVETPQVAPKRVSRPGGGGARDAPDFRGRADDRPEEGAEPGAIADTEDLLAEMIGTTTLKSSGSEKPESELALTDERSDGDTIRGWETSSVDEVEPPESEKRGGGVAAPKKGEEPQVDRESKKPRSRSTDQAPEADGGVVVFSEPSYRGRWERLTTDDRDLSDNEIGANEVSSVRVGAGCSAVLFTKVGFEGRSRTVSEDSPDLRKRLRDRLIKIHRAGSGSTSSIKVHCEK